MTTELVAVVVAMLGDSPHVLTAPETRERPRLPSGPLQTQHRTMQAGMRSWVEQQTGYGLKYVEQLYTFADPGRGGSDARRIISVSYLGLTRATIGQGHWVPWYELFPWEDQRFAHEIVTNQIAPALDRWVEQAEDSDERAARRQRCDADFGLGGYPWVPDLILQRYELLYEAGLVAEAGGIAGGGDLPATELTALGLPALGLHALGRPMSFDHRRIVATGIARLRAKSQYRPVVFELMPEEFTLGQLQTVVEALTGQNAHKQNFRRLISQQNLVEETGGTSHATGGRPARMYRFRRDVLLERHIAGTHVPVTKSR